MVINENKVIDYFVYSTRCKTKLHERIRELLNEGWHLYGNPWSDVDNRCNEYDIWIHQALVKYE